MNGIGAENVCINMTDIWFISDTHFNHANILKFTDKNNNHFRGDLFKSVDEMNETMINNWNEVVKPSDKIYHLGDVYFGREDDSNNILKRLNGKKRLILGNHDNLNRQSILFSHFQKIKLWWPFENMIFTHIPLAKEQMKTRSGDAVNFHGHIHQNDSPTKFHYNLCVEKIGYKPIHIDDLRKIRDETFND